MFFTFIYNLKFSCVLLLSSKLYNTMHKKKFNTSKGKYEYRKSKVSRKKTKQERSCLLAKCNLFQTTFTGSLTLFRKMSD